MSHSTHVRISDATRAKIVELRTIYSTQTEIICLAIDLLYRREIEQNRLQSKPTHPQT
jgi:hypothetical protein